MLKLTFREIRTSLGRFLGIFAIIALGAGFFCGLKLTKTSMIHTLDVYAGEQHMFDYDLVSTVGFDDDDVAAIERDSAVKLAEGSKQADAIFVMPSGSIVLHTMSVPEKLNLPRVTAGRLPETEDECALDAWYFSEDLIGKTITLSEDNDEDDLENFRPRTFTVTGLCKSPLYINYERGGTSIGSGSVTGFAFLTEDAFDTDYYTHLYLTLEGVSGEVYSDEYEDFVDAAEDHITDLGKERAEIRSEKLREDAEQELADARVKLDDAHKEIDDAKVRIEDGKKDIEDGKKKIEDGENEYYDAVDAFAAYRRMMRGFAISDNTNDFNKKQAELDDAWEEIVEHKQELADAEQDLKDGEQDLKDAEKKLADAEQDYADGEKKLDDLDDPDCYVLDRSTNVGYVCFESDSEIVHGVSKVFPVFFFLVAALVCITTMTRMVDEQRTQLGVLKAMGYSDGAIMSKFLLYSALASVLGCAGGIALGAWAMPKLIWQAYNIMYGFADIINAFDWKLAIASSAAYLVCSLFATWLACRSELAESAASLIRPRAPKAGKRVLLEHVGFIWKRIPFLRKVSIRNVLRYKQRMMIMILGIGGCTALLLTGYGIRDSIQNVVSYQYDEISDYDCSVNFKDDMTPEMRAAFCGRHGGVISDSVFLHDTVKDCSSDTVTKTAHIIVTENDTAGDYMLLKDGGETVEYPGRDECVISVGLSEALGIGKGDTLRVYDDETGEMNLKITGVFNNYVYNYVFVTNETFTAQTGAAPEMKCAWLRFGADKDSHAAGAEINGDDEVASTQLTVDLEDRMSTMMSSLDYIVVVVVVSAGALAFIVLCSLTNISITERLREIATVKVLGFYDRETASYVFRENNALTVIGSLVGIPMGYALHRFVMEQIRIDLVHFDARILPTSIITCVALTLLFALIVNLAMKPKLRRIDMAQALKSIE